MFFRRLFCCLGAHNWVSRSTAFDVETGRPVYYTRQCLICGRIEFPDLDGPTIERGKNGRPRTVVTKHDQGRGLD